MLADVAKRQIADIHPVNHQRARNAKHARRGVRAQFLILGHYRHPFAPRQMAEKGLDD